jgi:DNA-binding IscR family transcriptional regulator
VERPVDGGGGQHGSANSRKSLNARHRGPPTRSPLTSWGLSGNTNSYMNRDSRLSVALHVLLHMSQMRAAVTSEALGSMMATNPVVVRRILGGLRDAGIVAAVKGRGGGWMIARDLQSTSLYDVYEALDITTLFGIGVRNRQATCPIENGINKALVKVLHEAEAQLITGLRAATVATILSTATRSSASRSNAS